MATRATPNIPESGTDKLRGDQPVFSTPGESPSVAAARMGGPSMVPNTAGDHTRTAPKARQVR